MDLNLSFDNDYMHNYHSSTQIARVLTESWMERIVLNILRIINQ